MSYFEQRPNQRSNFTLQLGWTGISRKILFDIEFQKSLFISENSVKWAKEMGDDESRTTQWTNSEDTEIKGRVDASMTFQPKD